MSTDIKLIVFALLIAVVVWLFCDLYLHREECESAFLIENLRNDTAASVTLLCDNEEGNGDDNNAVEVCAEWTDWKEERFYGRNLNDALRNANFAKLKHEQKNAK